MMADFSSFHDENALSFAKHHKISLQEAKQSLLTANQFAFQHVSSWAVADIDGNKRRDRQSMEIMEKGLQLAIVERYMQHIEPLLADCPSLNASQRYLKRCQRALNDGIFFNLEGAWIAKQRLIQELNKACEKDNPSDAVIKQITTLQEFVDIVGFRGSLKQFVRQSSKANADVFQNFFEILSNDFAEITRLTTPGVAYKDWPEENKQKFHYYLRTNSAYFRSLRDQQASLRADTVRELDILDFVHDYRDQFDYILSDTQSYTSMDEVIILFAFARYRLNRLAIDDIKCPPVNLIPLCETPEDLARLEEILNDMLSNPYLKHIMIKKQELIYVAGPSDLGKEGGLFAHINLIEAEKIAQAVLKRHQAQDPRLQGVQLRVLYGLGGDVHRRVAEASAQLFATFQGAEACAIGAPFAFKAHVERVTGSPSENTLRAQELSQMADVDAKAYAYLKQMVGQCIEGYRDYIHHPASKALFRMLTIDETIGRMTNTSSRAESKTAKAKDITLSRAIGIANYDLASPIMTRIIMSADGLTHLGQEFLPYLPRFFQESLTVKEQVLKILFAIAVADEKRAWRKLLGRIPTTQEIDLWGYLFKIKSLDHSAVYALAHVHRQIPEILKSLLYFLPPILCYEASERLDQLLLDCATYREVTLKLLGYLGQHDPIFRTLKEEIEEDLLPRYQQLATCIDAYEQRSSNISPEDLNILQENIVLALRGDRRIAQGPLCIVELSSVLKGKMPELNSSKQLRP
jgi:hypothetical protein